MCEFKTSGNSIALNQCLLVDVLLEHTTLYHLNWQMLSPCSHNCGNPSFWKSWGIVTESIRHLIVLSLVKWWTVVSELASIVHFPRVLQCHLINWCRTFFFSSILSSTLIEDHVNAILKHVYGILIFNKNIWSPMLNVSCSIIQTPLYG